MDLSTKYLGFDLPHPLMPGASPLADNLDSVKQLEDAGAAAIVMRSLFEEQIMAEQLATNESMDGPAESFAEALNYFPSPEEFVLGPQEYLEHLRKVKEAVSVLRVSVNPNLGGIGLNETGSRLGNIQQAIDVQGYCRPIMNPCDMMPIAVSYTHTSPGGPGIRGVT